MDEVNVKRLIAIQGPKAVVVYLVLKFCSQSYILPPAGEERNCSSPADSTSTTQAGFTAGKNQHRVPIFRLSVFLLYLLFQSWETE